MTVLDLMRPDLKNQKKYQASSIGNEHRMHMNELPWSTSSEFPINHYPDPKNEFLLQQKLAKLYQVNDDQLFLTRGSDEGIDWLMRLFLRPGLDSIMHCPPTFPMYAFFAQLQQGGVIACPLHEKNNFEYNIEEVKTCWKPECKLIALCRPNNPTGNSFDLSFIVDLCKTWRDRSVIVVDEAYIEFSNQESAATLIQEFDNLIILRTLSKAKGLAGLRVGAILSQSNVIEALKKMSPPYRLASTVIELALQFLPDEQWMNDSINRVLNAKEKLKIALEKSPWIEKIYPSFANFLLIKTVHAEDLFQWFKENGILVRYFANNPALQNYLRISVGDEQQNESLLEVLKNWSKK